MGKPDKMTLSYQDGLLILEHLKNMWRFKFNHGTLDQEDADYHLNLDNDRCIQILEDSKNAE